MYVQRVRVVDAACGVAICRIIVSFARLCRVGVWFGFVRSALLLAVVACIVLSFEAMPGLCCFLRVTHWNSPITFILLASLAPCNCGMSDAWCVDTDSHTPVFLRDEDVVLHYSGSSFSHGHFVCYKGLA